MKRMIDTLLLIIVVVVVHIVLLCSPVITYSLVAVVGSSSQSRHSLVRLLLQYLHDVVVVLAVQSVAFANNMISYMISSKGEISVPPKNFYRELFILTPNQAKYYLMLGVIPMPFLLLGLSIWLWFKRARFQ